ncbi:uncharacterized protein LOC8071836 [Sorghum bicolor]|uniref:uncharacterized protein LOC8071836 n=1 Tax=Sorghum bicolor TaxID=4558 RepID=UPI000B42524C|nr:uncharacterized protein LOC8071836 [Sorghum bicolor]|eukprot:XP_021317684.1 uncharacterized protein LOC8071836 [Sorghum bicolor]
MLIHSRTRKDGFYSGVDHRAAASQDPRPPAASVLWLPFHLCASCRSSPRLPYTSSYRHLLLTRIVEPPPHQPFLRRPSSPPLRPWAVHTASLHQPRGALLYSYCSGLPIVVHLCPLGRIVRDSNITPIRVKKWTDISPAAQKHIFDAIKDKFENANPDIEIDVYKAEIMEHTRDLWNNWRGDLNRQFVKPARNMQQAIKNCPKGIKQPDWEWLVKEHFYSKDFIDRSKRNSKNRSNLKILHHSGSKPYRQIIWDNGGKENNPPTLDKLFSLTHMKDGTFVDSETSTKHAEIEVERLLNPTLSNVELMDKCFESNRRDHVVGYGGGIRARDIRSPTVTKAELIEKLTQSEQEKKELQEDNQTLHEENRMITSRVSRMEEEWAELKSTMSASLTRG